MRAAFGDYILKYWRDEYSVYRTSPRSGKPERYVTRREARSQLGFDAKYINYLVDIGVLKAAVRQTGRRRMFLVEAGSLAEVKRASEGTLSVTQASQKLAVSCQPVGSLLKNGCMAAAVVVKVNRSLHRRIPAGEVEKLLQAIRTEIANRREVRRGKLLSFRTVRLRLMSYNISIPFFVKSILLDAVAPCGEDATKIGLRRFLFRSSDIDAYLAHRHQRAAVGCNTKQPLP